MPRPVAGTSRQRRLPTSASARQAWRPTRSSTCCSVPRPGARIALSVGRARELRIPLTGSVGRLEEVITTFQRGTPSGAFGYAMPDRPVEIVTARLTARADRPGPALGSGTDRLHHRHRGFAPSGSRQQDSSKPNYPQRAAISASTASQVRLSSEQMDTHDRGAAGMGCNDRYLQRSGC